MAKQNCPKKIKDSEKNKGQIAKNSQDLTLLSSFYCFLSASSAVFGRVHIKGKDFCILNGRTHR